MVRNKVRIAADGETTPLSRFYMATGYANADFTYMPPMRKAFEYMDAFAPGFRYVRMHNLLTLHGRGDEYLIGGMTYGNPPPEGYFTDGGDAQVKEAANGALSYDFALADRVCDILLAHGVRPIVETVYMPHLLQRSAQQWYIPRDYGLWRQCIARFTQHMQERYGADEVERWYFEVWNEPDNHAWFRERPETFNALYDYMADGVHSVNPRIRVGGPAIKQSEDAARLLEGFLTHCSEGLNYATGRFGTRLDFISVHCKGGRPSDGIVSPSTDIMFYWMKRYCEIIKKYQIYEHTELLNDESDAVWSGQLGVQDEAWLHFRNTHYFPGFICKMVSRYAVEIMDELGMNLSMVVSDNFHIPWEGRLFSGNRSLLTPLFAYPSTDFLIKPAYNAYRMLGMLGEARLNAACPDAAFGRKFGALATKGEGYASILLWHFEDGMSDDAPDREIEIELTGIEGRYHLLHYRIDSCHSNACACWAAMGKPSMPTVGQVAQLRRREQLELLERPRSLTLSGTFATRLVMPMHSVSLLLFVSDGIAPPAPAEGLKLTVERSARGQPQVFLKWRPFDGVALLRYDVYRRSVGEEAFRLISDGDHLSLALYADTQVTVGQRYEYCIDIIDVLERGSGPSEVCTILVE